MQQQRQTGSQGGPVSGDWNLSESKNAAKRRKQNEKKQKLLNNENGPLTGHKPAHGTQGSGPLSGHKRVMTADMYLSNIQRFQSDSMKSIADRVRHHCADRGMRVIYARVFPSKFSRQHVGCRIVIPATQADDALTNRMWPADVTCRRWRTNNDGANTKAQNRPSTDNQNMNQNHNKSYADLRFDRYDSNYGGRYVDQPKRIDNHHQDRSDYHDATENWESSRNETRDNWEDYSSYDDRSRSRNSFGY